MVCRRISHRRSVEDTITYIAPFALANREEDHRVAWAVFGNSSQYRREQDVLRRNLGSRSNEQA